MNIDNLINNILDSYNKYGLINRSDEENFPNRQNVVKILQDLEFLIFPGFKYAEETLQIAYDKFLNDDNFTRIMSEEFSDIIDEAYEYVKEKYRENKKEKIMPPKEKYPDR